MRNFILGLSISLAFILGTLFSMSLQPAAASSRYGKCFGAKLYTMNGSNLNAGMDPQKIVSIPKGWTVAGGSGGYVLLCR